MTPGAPYTPQTPGAMSGGIEAGSGDWLTQDIMVKIRDSHDDTRLIHQVGCVRFVSVSIKKEKRGGKTVARLP